jgi:hypothetical protein
MAKIFKKEILRTAVKKAMEQLKYIGENNEIKGIQEICGNIEIKDIEKGEMKMKLFKILL